jgi:hypothetical protein
MQPLPAHGKRIFVQNQTTEAQLSLNTTLVFLLFLWYCRRRSLPEKRRGRDSRREERRLYGFASFFLCARSSGRALLAASLLQSMAENRFEIWSTPTQDIQDYSLIEHVLQEQGVTLLAPDRLIRPAFGLRWDEGIILCSGLTDT